MIIHFICRGNTHRSRLAEAYTKSLTQENTGLSVISSGIEADRNLNGPIVAFVKLLLEKDNLLKYTGTTWTQTTQQMIDDSDMLIFMSDDVYEDAVNGLKIPLKKTQIWRIPDAQGVNEQINSNVDELIRQLDEAK
jgi:protein-tyrosine-phosphatase